MAQAWIRAPATRTTRRILTMKAARRSPALPLWTTTTVRLDLNMVDPFGDCGLNGASGRRAGQLTVQWYPTPYRRGACADGRTGPCTAPCRSPVCDRDGEGRSGARSRTGVEGGEARRDTAGMDSGDPCPRKGNDGRGDADRRSRGGPAALVARPEVPRSRRFAYAAVRQQYRWCSPPTRGRASTVPVPGRGSTGRGSGESLSTARCVRSSW